MLYTDASITTVDGAFTVLDDPIDVIDGSEWPASDFTVKVWSAADPKVLKAVIYVGTRTTNSLSSLTWNYGGHTDVNLADGDYIALSSTRFDYQTKEYVHYLAGRMEDETPHALDDFFTANTLADYTQTTPSGNATPVIARGVQSWTFDSQASQVVVPFTKAFGAISAPITIETRIRVYGGGQAVTGLCFTDGTATSSSILFVGLVMNSAGAVPRFASYGGTITNINVAPTDVGLGYAIPTGSIYFRQVWKSANTWRAGFSVDGVTYTEAGGGDLAFTQTPTRLGTFVSTYGGGAGISALAAFDYLRVTEADLLT